MCLRTVRLQSPCVIEVANVLRLVTTGLRSYSELSVIQRCPYYRRRNSQRIGVFENCASLRCLYYRGSECLENT